AAGPPQEARLAPPPGTGRHPLRSLRDQGPRGHGPQQGQDHRRVRHPGGPRPHHQVHGPRPGRPARPLNHLSTASAPANPPGALTHFHPRTPPPHPHQAHAAPAPAHRTPPLPTRRPHPPSPP